MMWNLLVLAGGLTAGYRLLTIKEGQKTNLLASTFLVIAGFYGTIFGAYRILRDLF